MNERNSTTPVETADIHGFRAEFRLRGNMRKAPTERRERLWGIRVADLQAQSKTPHEGEVPAYH